MYLCVFIVTSKFNQEHRSPQLWDDVNRAIVKINRLQKTMGPIHVWSGDIPDVEQQPFAQKCGIRNANTPRRVLETFVCLVLFCWFARHQTLNIYIYINII